MSTPTIYPRSGLQRWDAPEVSTRPPTIYPRDPDHPEYAPPSEARPGPLTAREAQVVQMLADGLSAADVGRELWLSHWTIKTHVRNCRWKLGARTTTHVVATALRGGLIK